jgi:hypothetical protein
VDAGHLANQLFGCPSFQIAAWRDPAVESAGWRADSDEMLVFSLPCLGPTSVAVWHRSCRYVSDGAIASFEPVEFAATFGVMPSVAAKAVGRLVLFGMARFSPRGIEVRTHVPPLPHRWVVRMPSYLAVAYREFERGGAIAA